MTKELVQTGYLLKKDTVVTIKDPKTFQPLCKLKNPKVPIQRKGKRFIDLEENILKNAPPAFNEMEVENYGDQAKGWEMLMELTKAKNQNRTFWEFIDKLKSMRVFFNTILSQKFR